MKSLENTRNTRNKKWNASEIPSQAGRVAIVTGSSSGIGFETARVLADKGAEVIIAVRNQAKGDRALAKIMAQHPKAEVTVLTSETYAGKCLAEIYPSLGVAGDRELTKLEQAELNSKNVDLVFLAVPHGESMSLAPGLLEAGVKVIDLSGDFRFPDRPQP